MKAKIKTYYFSPTGGTLKVLRSFAEPLAMLLHADVEYHSYTLPQEREALPVFDKDDIVAKFLAQMVYVGTNASQRTALGLASDEVVREE